MAEFVEFRAEEWIEELELMERIGLFEPKEIKSIANRRKEFEYKIQRRTKCKEDYLKYIQFEIDLHRIVKARREKTGIKSKISEIDYSQTHRIGNLFKQAIFKFQSDVKLWLSFFKFCKGVKFHSLVSQMLVRMLQIHANKPELWIFAAKWEVEQCKSINNARQFLTKGLRHHPSCELLYQELFKLELLHIKQTDKEIKKKMKENEEFTPDEVITNIMAGKVAEVVYLSAVKVIQGVDIKVSLLNIAKETRAPAGLRNKILQDIVKDHLNEELAWDAIAKMELEGFECDINLLTREGELMEVDEERMKTARDRIQRSINVYEESIKRLNTITMWSFYLDFVVNLNEDSKSLPVFKKKLLTNAMEGAMNSDNMAENYYLTWIEKLESSGKNKKLSQVLKKGTEDYPKSVRLWYARLRFYLSRDEEKAGMDVFNEAAELLTDAAPVWNLAVKYLQLKSSPKAEEYLEAGIKRRGDVAQTLKPLYLEWMTESKGIEEARKLFESPEMNFPPCLQLYKKMADLELGQSQPCLEKVRKCHELACSNFGTNDSSVWLDYARFELEKGDPANVAKIHRRALKSLKPKCADEFLSEYNNIKLQLST